MLGTRAVGIEAEREPSPDPRQIPLPALERHVAPAVAVEVDPGRIEGMIALRDERDLRALEGPKVPLPLDRLVGLGGVGGEVIRHLADEQGGRVDHRHADRIGPGVAGRDHEIDRLVEPARLVRQARRETPLRAGHERHLPRLRDPAFPPRRDDRHGLLPLREPFHRHTHDELPAPHVRRHALDHVHPMLGIVRRRSPRLTPGERGAVDPHPRGRRDAQPRRDEPGGRGEQALRGGEFVDHRGDDERREDRGQPQREGAIHHALAGHLR